MKTTSLFKVFNSLKTLKLEDIKISSILDSVKSLDLNPNSIRSVISDFVLIRRNRLIISSGLASILLLSLLPPQIELVLNRRSTLSQYQSEDSLLDQLQVELDNVKSQLISRNKLKDSISKLIPDQDEAEKTIPLLLTSLLNSSSLSLVEIVPIDESSYVSDSDEDSLADLENLFDEDNGEDFYSPDEESNFDDIPYEDDFENSDSFPQTDFAEDDLNEDNPFDEFDVSASANGSTSSLFYSISLQGNPSNIYEFFESLHSTNILFSIGRVLFDNTSSRSNDRSSAPSSNATNTQMLSMTFTLKVAINSISPQSLNSTSQQFNDPSSFDNYDQSSDESAGFNDLDISSPLDDPSLPIPDLPILDGFD